MCEVMTTSCIQLIGIGEMKQIAARIALLMLFPIARVSSILGSFGYAYDRAFLLDLFNPDGDESSQQPWKVRQLLNLFRLAKS